MGRLQQKPSIAFWRRIVGEDAGQGWQIADPAIELTEQPSNSIDILRHRIEIVSDTAYFTTCKLEKQWGDDWDDAPYKRNAGEPYEWDNHLNVPPYQIHILKFSGPYETPADLAGSNSRYSVEQSNAGSVAEHRAATAT